MVLSNVTLIFLALINGIPEKLGSGRKVWTLGVWTPGRLESRRLEYGQLDAWTLDAWTLDLWIQETLSIFSDIYFFPNLT